MLLFGIQYSDLDFEGEIIFFFFSILGCDNLQKFNDITFTIHVPNKVAAEYTDRMYAFTCFCCASQSADVAREAPRR